MACNARLMTSGRLRLQIVDGVHRGPYFDAEMFAAAVNRDPRITGPLRDTLAQRVDSGTLKVS